MSKSIQAKSLFYVLRKSGLCAKKEQEDETSNNIDQHFTTFLAEINHLVACSTYVRKKNYSTWQHPRSKLRHQNDHIFCRIIDTFVSKPLLDTDHLSVHMKLRIAACLYRKSQRNQPLKLKAFA